MGSERAREVADAGQKAVCVQGGSRDGQPAETGVRVQRGVRMCGGWIDHSMSD